MFCGDAATPPSGHASRHRRATGAPEIVDAIGMRIAHAHRHARRLQIKRVYPTLTSLPSLSIIRSIDEQMIDFGSGDELALTMCALDD